MQASFVMRCEECGIQAPPDARGWRGFRVDDPEEGDEPAVGYYCPECASREFGDWLSRPREDPADG